MQNAPAVGIFMSLPNVTTIHVKSIALHLDWYPTIKANLKDLTLNLELILS